MHEKLHGKLFLGVVEDIADPDRKGRIKIRIQGVFDEIPLEDIPWASPYKSLSGKAFELPRVGKIVNVLFPNADLYDPHYISSENYNVNLENILKEYSEEEYEGFVALLFDHRTQVFADDKTLTMDYKYNRITIDNSNINIEAKDNNQKVNIGTKKATQQAMLGNHWLDWFDTFVQTLQQPTSLIGNLGAPIIRPQLDKVLSDYWVKRETFISDHVYITDDRKIKKLE
jgi:hypothetical protein